LQRKHVEKAVSRYSLLFTLPSYAKIVACLCIQCVATGVIGQLQLSSSPQSLIWGIVVGVMLFTETFIADYVICKITLKNDLILDLRRCSFISLASNLIITGAVCFAALASFWLGDVVIYPKVVAMGFFVALSLSFLVFCVLSFMSSSRIILAATLQPTLFLFLFLISHLPLAVQGYSMLYMFLAGSLAFVGVKTFIADMNTLRTRSLGIPSVKMFRAFLANWTEGLVKPFEDVLEQFSEERDITVSLIAFKTGNSLKTVMVVPAVHPGPFKNIGSSAIPSMIQTALEKKLGCIVSVPHGISGHELDLASQTQNAKLIELVLESVKFDAFSAKATPFETTKLDGATAGCQIFGDCALVTLTLAPETMEDLPLELNEAILQEAQKKGLSWVVAIDAHNSIQGLFDVEKAVKPIEKASKAIIELASSRKQLRFKVGVAKVVPIEFSVEDGMGPGGITVTVVRMDDQTTAYVTIDGNNMVSGLREKILEGLLELGISSGEIFTTDTHVVNAVVMNEMGYNPVGKAIDHQRLIENVKQTAALALGTLEPAEVSWQRMTVQGVRIIGEQQIDKLSLIVDEGAKKAKKTSTIVFPAFGFALAVLLSLF
jgi:putative membrane protein